MLASSASAATAASEPLRLLYVEPLGRLTFDETSADPAAVPRLLRQAGGGRLAFEAYGRRFELDLSPNDRLLSALDEGSRESLDSQLRYFSGKAAGLPGSWARLTVAGEAISGAVWDGEELYVLDSVERARALSVVPLEADGGTVVFRASDALLSGRVTACGGVSPEAPASLASETRKVLREIRAGQAKPGASREIRLAVVADAEFADLYGGATAQALLERLNIADGLYSEQLGLQLVVAELRVFDGEPDPFSESNDRLLLKQLADWSSREATLKSVAMTYLFSGREVCGEGLFGCSVNGLSSATLCAAGAAALGESLGEVYLDALLFAHELGHNLGAVHDGIEVCAATPSGGFLMSQFTEKRRETLSQCSLAQMSATLASASASASCVLPIAGAPPPPEPPPLPSPSRSPGSGSGSSGGGGAMDPLLLLLGLAIARPLRRRCRSVVTRN